MELTVGANMVRPRSNDSREETAQPGIVNAGLLLVGAIMGLVASIGLLEAELNHLRNPAAVLECDVNPLIGCGSSLMSKQAHIFGIPNSLLGTILFTAIAVVALLSLLRAHIPMLAWWALALGALAGCGFVLWFLYLSATLFHALCPFCLIVWSGTLIVASVAVPQAVNACRRWSIHLKGNAIARYTGLIAVALHLLIILIVTVTMRDQIGVLL
ncbi:MAG: vitamin K epoxide reductase family protein [Actinomycetaceae bacterium]|nr:vitamin K epoxide reductase family protein [Actinomycetaceae bacterium]